MTRMWQASVIILEVVGGRGTLRNVTAKVGRDQQMMAFEKSVESLYVILRLVG